MTDLYLKSGIFLAPFHNHDENPTLSIERDFELLEHLDRLNYHEAWIGEHHSGGFELIACPEMFIAAATQRTRHIRLGTGVVSLPYHNPFMLADRMVQLDHMTRGRAMFGGGPGALVHDALKIGIDPSDQRRMMNEALEVIIPLLRGETVNRKTDWFNLTEAQLQLRCYTRPTMELAGDEARKNVQFGVQAFANYFRDVATFPIIPPDVPDPYEWLVETGTGCISTPDDAIAYIERLIAGSGGFGVLCELAQNWADWEATKRHYELMARFVHPHFQQSRELLQGSYDYATDR